MCSIWRVQWSMMCSIWRHVDMPQPYFHQALVDGPCTGIRRQAMNFNKLWLTDFKIKISPSAREKQVRKRFTEADILAKWEKTSWAKKIALKKRRKELTDFDRFKLKVLKQQVFLTHTPIYSYRTGSPCTYRLWKTACFLLGPVPFH